MNKKQGIPGVIVVMGFAVLACNLPSAGQPVAEPEQPIAEVPTEAPPDNASLPPTPTEEQNEPTQSSGESTVCVPPADVPLPAEPPAFSDLPDFLQTYLSAGGSVDTLAAKFQEWGVIDEQADPPSGTVRGDLDFTGDGIADVLVAARDLDQFPVGPYWPGNLFLLTCQNGQFVMQYTVAPTDMYPELVTPQIYALDDLTGDGVPDVLYDMPTCGASTCFSNAQGVRWDASTGSFVTLLPEPINQPYSDFTITDQTGDGLLDIVVDGGMMGSAGAGPQRAYQYIYSWDGSLFTLEEQTLISNQHPIHLVNDADDLLIAGDYAGAITLYEQSYTDPSLERELWDAYEGWQRDLEAYARYKMIIATVQLGDQAGAQALYDQLLADYPDAAQPGGVYVGYARLFWEAYTDSGDVGSACEAVTSQLPEDFSGQITLNMYGYANKYYEALDMCPFVTP